MNPVVSVLPRPEGFPEFAGCQVGELTSVQARSAQDHEMAQGKKFLVPLPCGNLEEGVQSDNEEELPLRILAAEMTDGFNRIRFSFPLKLHITYRKGWVILNRQPNELETMVRRDLDPFALMRGYRNRDKAHSVEVKSFPSLLSTSQMAEMDGVECPPKNS